MKALVSLLIAPLALAAGAESGNFLKPSQTIALPGVSGRVDHLAADVARRRLFVAALANDTVEILDLAAGQHLLSLKDVREPQGLLFLPKPNLLFVANSRDGQLKIYDCDSFRAIKTVGGLPDADNLRYDAFSGRVYVGYGTGALGLLNAISGVHTLSIELSGHPESFQLEEHGSRIFVNLPQARGVAVVDRLTRSVEKTWPLRNASQNFPMALDEDHQRLFIGCRKPPRLVVLNTADGKSISEVEISGDTDDLFLDARRKRLYLACGEGFLDVIALGEGDSYKRVNKIPTAAGARTGLFVPELDLFCLAVPKRGTQQCEIRLFQPQP